jgi:prepilin peptidase CpaA
MAILELVRLTLFPALMAFAACSDLLTMSIPNRVSLILVGGFFALAFAGGTSPLVVLIHIGAACIVLAAMIGLFSRGWVGGGDAKLAAATALWFGFDDLLPYLLHACMFGGALTLALAQFRALPLPPRMAQRDWVQRLHCDGGIPYGIALAASALAVYPQTVWMAASGL